MKATEVRRGSRCVHCGQEGLDDSWAIVFLHKGEELWCGRCRDEEEIAIKKKRPRRASSFGQKGGK